MYCFIMYWPTDNSDILSLYTCLLLKSTSSKCFRWHVYCSNPHRQSVSVDMSTVEIHIVKVFLMTCLLLKSTSSKVFPLTCLLLKSTLSMCFHWHVYCWNPHCQSASIDMSMVEIHKYQSASDDMSTGEIHTTKCIHWHVYFKIHICQRVFNNSRTIFLMLKKSSKIELTGFKPIGEDNSCQTPI
jgi:hypothetical protein